jgi:hypothetical protein
VSSQARPHRLTSPWWALETVNRAMLGTVGGLRLGIDGIDDIFYAHFAVIRVYFAFGVSENTTKYTDIVRMISSISSLKGDKRVGNAIHAIRSYREKPCTEG